MKVNSSQVAVDESERKSNLQYIFIKDNMLKGNGFHPVLCLERSEKSEKKIKEAITKKVHGKQTMPKMIFENKIFN